MRRLLLHIAILGLPWLVPQQATAALRAQLVVVSPGDRLYQLLGHCALAVRSLSYSRFICSPNTFST